MLSQQTEDALSQRRLFSCLHLDTSRRSINTTAERKTFAQARSFPRMSLRRVALMSLATAALTAAGAQAAPFPEGLAHLASTAVKSAPCASGNAAMGAAVGASATTIAKKTGV